MVVPLCCGYFKKLNTTVKRLKEEKRQEGQTKREMESAKDMLSFVLLAFWQHLMNGPHRERLTSLSYVATRRLVLGIVFHIIFIYECTQP